jgi:antitoxin PrlF
MITSKLTSKAQTTVPQPVRAALGLKAGDLLWYELAEGQVILRKSPPIPARDDPFGAFDEWHTMADQKAYGRL